MFTVKQIVEELLPDELKVPRDEFTGASTGSLFSTSLAVNMVNQANLNLAKIANNLDFWNLRGVYEFTLEPADLQASYVDVPLPGFMASAICLNILNGPGSTQDLIIGYVPYSDTAQVPGAPALDATQYRLQGGSLRIFQPTYQRYQFEFQRTPGALAYGTVKASPSPTTTVFQVTATGGTFSTSDEAYVGDYVAVTGSDGTLWRRKVVAYDAGTAQFTLEEALPFTPTAGMQFSVLSFLPDAHQDLLVYEAAALFTNLPEKAAESGARAGVARVRFEEQIRPVDTRTPQRPVMNLPRVLPRGQWAGGVGTNNSGWGWGN
jgi:hypothetical protein